MGPTLRSRRNKNGDDPPPALRQSPPPPAPQLRPAAAEKEPHSNRTSKQASRSAIRRIANPRTRPYYSRRCKEGISSYLDSLPDELLFDILLRVPAKDIHENSRFVCKRWKRLIHGDAFVQAHLQRAGYGVLIWTGRNDLSSFMSATRGGGIEVSKLSSKSNSFVKASCNGLLLVACIDKDFYTPYVVNPATKECFKLPKFRRIGGRLGNFGIAYAAASMVYKVSVTYRPFGHSSDDSLVCNVLTVGVDNTWRRVATQHLSPEVNWLLDRDPLITDGYMHWAFSSRNTVLTMNVETEVFVETSSPLTPIEYQVKDPKYRYHFLSTGRHLSVLVSCGGFSWDIWEMEGGSGEWRKVLPGIDLEAHKSKMQQLVKKDDLKLGPVGWLKYLEDLLFFFDFQTFYGFDSYPPCVIYHLDRDEIDSIKLPAPVHCCSALVHKNSLVCIR